MPADVSEAANELIAHPLPVIGAGLGKAVYGTKHWVVKQKRGLPVTASYFMVRRFTPRWAKIFAERLLSMDFPWGDPAGWLPRDELDQTRLEWVFRWRYAVARLWLTVIPEAWWLPSEFGREAVAHERMDREGQQLAEQCLKGTGLIPRRVIFPPIQVSVQGWPWRLSVCEAHERTDISLRSHLHQLDTSGRWEDLRAWLDRVAALQPRLWEHGVFNMDMNVLANHGILNGKVVLVDSGRLTNDPRTIGAFLDSNFEQFMIHNRRALTYLLPKHPEVRDYFTAQWRALLTRDNLSAVWPVKGAFTEGIA